MRLIALIATAALAASVLLACGGSDDSEPATAPAPPEATQQAQAADVPDDAVVSSTPKVYFIHTEW